MTTYQFDPDSWLVTTHRAIQAYVANAFPENDVHGDGLFDVEMGFPDTTAITKETPLDSVLIHFEQDDQEPLVIGFGTPGIEEFDEDTSTVVLKEAVKVRFNFDVGVWVSAECGGATKRMETVERLANLFNTAVAKKTMREETNGVYPAQFTGGRFVLDRVNDLPIWRATDMTLVVEVFGRVIPDALVPAIVDGFTLDDNSMTIQDGSLDEPVVTP